MIKAAMTFRSLLIPFTFAAGLGAGVGLTTLYNTLSEVRPPEPGDRFTAAVTDIYDADTMTLRRGGETYKIRIWGIDAPERSQRCLSGRNDEIVTCGLEARDRLRALLGDGPVTCEVKGRDERYDRLVARCEKDGADPAETLVRNGWAFNNTDYGPTPYEPAEREASDERRGLWGMDYMPPADWRACTAFHRAPDHAPETCLKPLGPLNPR